MSYLLLLLELYARFFAVGLFSIGGGLATLPFLQKMGEATGWFGEIDVSNMVAISESTPGPMGINMATYVGFITAGVPGAILAPLGEIAPALFITLIISRILKKFRDSKYVDYAFYGLRAASMGLILAATLSIAKIAFFDANAFASGSGFFSSVQYLTVALSAVIFALTVIFKKVHPIFWIILAAVVGILLKM